VCDGHHRSSGIRAVAASDLMSHAKPIEIPTNPTTNSVQTISL
jgi:hypothetical protein